MAARLAQCQPSRPRPRPRYDAVEPGAAGVLGAVGELGVLDVLGAGLNATPVAAPEADVDGVGLGDPEPVGVGVELGVDVGVPDGVPVGGVLGVTAGVGVGDDCGEPIDVGDGEADAAGAAQVGVGAGVPE